MAVVGDPDVVPGELEQPGHAPGGVDIVVDDEVREPAAAADSGPAAGPAIGSDESRAAGSRTVNSFPWPARRCGRRPSRLQLGEPPDQHLPDALADPRGVARRANGRRPGEHRAGILAAIPDAEDDGVLLSRDGDPGPAPRSVDLAAWPSSPTRTCSSRAGSASSRSGPGDAERVSCCSRSSIGDAPPHRGAGDRGGVQPPLPQLDLPAGDAREVLQVVDLPHQVLELALDGVLGPGEVLPRRRAPGPGAGHR